MVSFARVWHVCKFCSLIALTSIAVFPSTIHAAILSIDDSCTISILNRSVQAAPDGTWRLNNVPSFMGQVRARATCVRNGQTVFGQTPYFTVQRNGTTRIGAFETVEAEEVPVSLTFATGNNTLLYGDQTYFRLRVFADYADGSRKDVTRISSGINYSISNLEIARIDVNGVLQGLSSGTVLITARKDGTSAVLSATIVTTGDSDGDGLPDDYEQANGLDGNDPVDAFEDVDGDGLSALDEYLAGTDVNNPDTDGDDIADGEETVPGIDGFVTNPLLADSDNDGINDGLEVAVGTDPTDINSVNLGASIASLSVDPASVVITFNSIQGQDASAQLTVTGTTLDGEAIDLTRTDRGTNYTTSDPFVCNFGGRDGEVFAGQNGDCVVTADNSGFSDSSNISVRSFDPTALNYLTFSQGAYAVDVEGGYAYVGTADGLAIVDVSDPVVPALVGNLSLGTAVRDVRVRAGVAFLATDAVAAVVVDVSDATAPAALASLGAGIGSTDLALSRNQLYVAAGSNGLWVVNVANPAFPQQSFTVAASNSVQAVAVSAAGDLVAVVDGTSIRLLNRDPSGVLFPAGGVVLRNPRDLVIDGSTAFVADRSNGLTLVDISDPAAPSVSGVAPARNAGFPNDVVVAGNFAFLADVSFPNGVPVVEVSDLAAPLPRAVVDFTTLGLGRSDGLGIDVDNQYIYVVTGLGLQIARYQQFVDENGLAPEATITSPAFGDAALEGGTIPVTADALDDVAVAGVSFLVDGELVYTDISAPYAVSVPLPVAQSSAIISVLAVDYGGNTSPVDSVTISLLTDSDYDGLSDEDETLIYGTSPFAADTDDDGINDAAEISLGFDPLDGDMDNDGLADGEEIVAGADGYVTDPYDPDSDNDGMPDGFESRFGLNPLNPADATLDLDGDGYTNLEEYRQGFDPTTADSDADGMPDDYERRFGLDPNNPDDFFGDLDNDGVPNGVEYAEGTDPTNPDVTPPVVASLLPADGQGLPANSVLLVRFNEPVKADTLSEVVATMTDAGGQPVGGVVGLSRDGYVLSFDPVLNLAVNATYTFTLSGARDLAGNPMAVVYTASITTGDLADNTGPTRLDVTPFDGATGVPVNATLELYFDEAVQPTVLDDASFYLFDRMLNRKVPGSAGVSADGKRLFFVPETVLSVGRRYYLYVSGISDLAGNACVNCGFAQRIYFQTAFAADTTAPVLLASTVVDGDTNVPTNTRFILAYDEAIGALPVANIALTSNGVRVNTDVTVSGNRRQITLRPQSLLAPGVSYSLRVEGVRDLSGNLAPVYSAAFTTGTASDSTTGSITAWSFPSDATGVPLNPLLEVRLSERIDPVSVSADSLYLYDQARGRRVPGRRVLSADGRVLSFEPDAVLEPDRRYQLYVGYNAYLLDLAGNRIGGSFRRFTTGGAVDTAAPVLSASNVADGSAVMPVNGRVVLLLDEPVGDGCSPAVRLLDSGGAVVPSSYAIATDRRRLTLTPDAELLPSTAYRVSVSNLCDYAGNALSGDVLRFSTVADAVADTTGPSLVSITPASGATGVPVDTTVVMTFDEVVDELSAPPVNGGGVLVRGRYTVSGTTVTFTPDAPLQGGVRYGVSLSRTVSDAAGNSRYLGTYYFTTESLVDATAPTVVAVSPVDGAVGVSPGTTVELTFSEPMASSTVTRNTIALYANGSVILPTVTRSADGQQVTLTASLPASSVVSVVVTDGVEDLSGNGAVPAVSTFTTGPLDTDASRPRVTRQVPASGSRDWSGVDEVVLYVSEALEASSVASALHVSEDGVLVDGTVEVLGDGRTVRFRPLVPFSAGALVQVFLESLATDLSGNAVYDYDGYFNMGGGAALVGQGAYPTVYAPARYRTDVPLNPFIRVRFNEPLDPAGLGGALIELRNNVDGTVVPVTVSLDASGYVLQVRPQALLAAGTLYQLRLRDIIDTDGDTNTQNYYLPFTTDAAAVEDNRQPVVLAMSPPDGAVDVGVDPRYAVRFDERITPLSFEGSGRYDVQFSEDDRVVLYRRLGVLDAGRVVTEVVPGASDVAGNAVVPVSATFTTGAGPDVVAPTVTGSIPNGATGVATNAVVAWSFDEPIDPVSVTSTGVYLYDQQINSEVPATVSLSADGRRIDIVPDSALLVGRRYAYYAGGLRDLGGNGVGTSRSFTTGFAADVTAPVVVSTTVVEGQTGVPTNVRLTVQFDEALSALGTGQVSLLDAGGAAVAQRVTLSGDRRSLTVVPTQLLGSNQTYTLRVEGVEDLSGNRLTTPLAIRFTTGATADFIQGSITAWSFPSDATGVPLNPLLEVRLSERIDPVSVSADSLYLYDQARGRRVPGRRVLSADGRVLSFEPDAVLEPDRRYQLYVGYNAYLLDLAGNRIGGSFRRFTTGGAVDTAAPVLSASNVADGSAVMPVNGRVVLLLDEPVGDGCSPAVRLLDSGGAVVPSSYAIATDRRRLTLTPDAELLPSTAYRVSVSNLCDYAGNALSGDVLRFSTVADAVADTTGPSLVSITPASGATGVPVDTTVVMTFDEVVDELSAPPVNGGGVLVRGRYTVSGTTVTFTPDAPLQGGVRYGVSLSRTVSDAAGNSRYLGTYYFTTESLVDATAPTVVAVSPVDGAVGVSPGTTVELTFSEPMASSTVTRNTIALYANGSVILPTVTRSADGQQVTLTASLPASSVVSVVVTDGVEDLSGNGAVPAVSTFTTGPLDTDASRPRVTRQVPASGSRDWSGVDEVVLYVSEALEASSVASALHVSEDGVLVDGTVEVLGDGRTVRFRPLVPFSAGALVQVFLESLATDLSGNAVYDYDGYFNMGGGAALVGQGAYPTVYAPARYRTDVPLNPFIRVRFNEPLDPAGLGGALIELRNNVDGTVVPVTVSLDASGYVLQVRPQALLAAGTLYQLRLRDIIDTDGDTNTQNYYLPFTTDAAAVEDNRQPVVLAMSPPDGAVDVGVDPRYAVRFDERITPLSFEGSGRYDVQFSEDDRVVLYRRLGVLDAGRVVTEVVPGASDVAGNAVVPVSATFTTGAGPDVVAPTVTGSIPNGATGVATNAVVAWSFDEPIDPVSVTSTGVYLYDQQINSEVPATVSLSADGRRIDIVPDSALLVGRRYAYYAGGLRDLGGNGVGTSRSFTTGFAADVTAPVVVSTTVVEGQTGVPTNVRLTVQFDEALSALGTGQVSLLDAGGAAVAQRVTLSGDRRSLTVVPTQLLGSNQTYTLRVEGVEDLSGNRLTTPLAIRFTTGATATW